MRVRRNRRSVRVPEGAPVAEGCRARGRPRRRASPWCGGAGPRRPGARRVRAGARGSRAAPRERKPPSRPALRRSPPCPAEPLRGRPTGGGHRPVEPARDRGEGAPQVDLPQPAPVVRVGHPAAQDTGARCGARRLGEVQRSQGQHRGRVRRPQVEGAEPGPHPVDVLHGLGRHLAEGGAGRDEPQQGAVGRAAVTVTIPAAVRAAVCVRRGDRQQGDLADPAARGGLRRGPTERPPHVRRPFAQPLPAPGLARGQPAGHIRGRSGVHLVQEGPHDGRRAHQGPAQGAHAFALGRHRGLQPPQGDGRRLGFAGQPCGVRGEVGGGGQPPQQPAVGRARCGAGVQSTAHGQHGAAVGGGEGGVRHDHAAQLLGQSAGVLRPPFVPPGVVGDLCEQLRVARRRPRRQGHAGHAEQCRGAQFPVLVHVRTSRHR